LNPASHPRGKAIKRVAFADAAEVDLDAGALETNRVRVAIEEQHIAPDKRPRLFAFIGFGDAPLPREEAPAMAQRAGSDVKRAAGLAVYLPTQKQQFKKRRRDADRA
jgi:hypothetical protein